MNFDTKLDGMGIVVSAFPACGKSYLVKNHDGINLRMSDSDSSSYHWITRNGIRLEDPEWPYNYGDHIKCRCCFDDVIFVSSHEIVRAVLHIRNIPFITVYPNIELKDEWVERAKNRPDNQVPIDVMIANWDKWIHQCMEEEGKKIELQSGQYLKDVFDQICPTEREE